MSRRQRRSLSPNLFPFLAVLVCTLGTLILLLALVSQKAEESAEQMVDQQTESARLIAEEERWEAEKLIEHRRQQTAELDKRRSELAHVEDHARRLRDELNTLKQEIEATEREDDSTATAETQNRLVSLRRQTDREKELIRDLEKERDGKPPRVVIVPYKGSNGTDRRPIYVECTASAVIIQPEGVRITAGQLDGPMGPGNPLDAALRAVRSHWQKEDADAPPPYPLLLVRPSGIHAYGASRIAMSTWDDQFGYELIPENLELAFPVKDTILEVKLVGAVQDAVSRSRARIAGAPSKYSRFTPQRIAASSGTGNTTSGSVADGQPNTNPYAAGAAGDSGSERSGTTEESQFSGGSGADQFGGVGSLPGESIGGNGVGTAANGQYAGLGSPRLNGPQNFESTSGSGSGIRSGAGDFAIDGAGSDFFSEEDFLSGSGQAGSGQTGTGEDTGSTGPEGNLQGPGNPLGGEGQLASGQLVSGQMTGGGAGSGAANSAQSSSAGMAAAMADPGRQGSSFEMSQPADPHEKTFSETMENTYGASSRGSQGRGGGDGDAGERAAGGEKPILRAGNNWALPDSMLNRRGTSIVREMGLQCTADGFVLMPEGGKGVPQAFPIENGLVEKSVMELAQAIRNRVDRWGVAMQNGRWDPVLSVRVSRSGETRFRQLQTLMRNSGVRVELEAQR